MQKLFTDPARAARALAHTLDEVEIPGLPAPQRGKVRQSYDLDAGRRLMVTTDRLSAFDLNLTTIPFKGQVLTELSHHWFERTRDICPNHLIAVPDPNVTVCRRLAMLPVEVVVRGYLAGSTNTSLLTMYKGGARRLYGHGFPDGMRDNQRLDAPVITPTTKGDHGAHDEPLGPDDVARLGLVDAATWDRTREHALALFAFGQARARERGLILVDTKCEFGVDPDGTVVLADEVHTPDSSRYWDGATYEARFAAGEPPDAFDKDMVRRWVRARCDPYRGDVPAIPDEVREETADVYCDLFERLTGRALVPPAGEERPAERVARAAARWVADNPL
ncbi:phosphoribosylaminoimidazolesuccinocarboxamide synthase [Lichenibacterium dinghuense]|uniref:phosphoribosylaminoimidazolesuccinocarboxamide synthase n=1 Tax=Lichenibacterium dinghuense TaxID=2895977 RepID=UPI0028160096|nr:phosphoribosylaminoimidazolesuccinocarboxamide synthase [Lichenibacterium sp. 6Y81]